jgi:hypothetical protein
MYAGRILCYQQVYAASCVSAGPVCVTKFLHGRRETSSCHSFRVNVEIFIFSGMLVKSYFHFDSNMNCTAV